MRKQLLISALVAALAGYGGTVLAHGGGGGGGGMAGGDHMGGDSGGHMSAKGTSDTNGPNASDRDKGQARASDRRSAEGTENEKAGSHSKPAKQKSKMSQMVDKMKKPHTKSAGDKGSSSTNAITGTTEK